MTDLSKTIEAKSDRLNADDLMGGAKIIKVTKVSSVAGDQPIAINYEGDNGKPFYPCKTVRRVLVNAWGADGNAYVGRSMTLYRDPKVLYAGQEVGGIRVSHLSHIPKEMSLMLASSNKKKAAIKILPLKVEEPVQVPDDSTDTEELVEAGYEAASGGVDAYKEWIAGLTEADKKLVKSHHKEWTALAKEADSDAPAV